ncbi:hypothetical protein Xvtw_07875 [Xanthomonas campestris pv. vitiswoodrowii]|nr:hypothetical protein Xvtw_07875 [Xanthomonas campestris pv. vitiswoodrowii]
MLFIRPRQQCSADVFGPFIAANDAWLAAPLYDLLQRSDHLGRLQRQFNFERQPLAIEVIPRRLNNQQLRPSASWLCMKSIDQPC